MNSVPGKYRLQPKSLLILGYGDLAERLAGRLASESWKIWGLCRSAKVSSLAELHRGDAGDVDGLKDLLKKAPDQILVTLTPGQRTPEAYSYTYLRSVKNLIRLCRELSLAPHILFVSSTAVYGQNEGEVVDEYSATDANQFNGQILREAERLLERSCLPLTVLRFSGIYGRHLVNLEERLRGALPPFRLRHWTNRIHVQDVVGVMQFVLDRYVHREESLGVLLGSDLCPVQEGDIENWLRSHLQLPSVESAAALAVSGKQCSSLRLQRLGYRFVVEDFRVGYLLGR